MYKIQQAGITKYALTWNGALRKALFFKPPAPVRIERDGVFVAEVRPLAPRPELPKPQAPGRTTGKMMEAVDIRFEPSEVDLTQSDDCVYCENELNQEKNDVPDND